MLITYLQAITFFCQISLIFSLFIRFVSRACAVSSPLSDASRRYFLRLLSVGAMHRRSEVNARKNRIRGLIFGSSFHDPQQCETVCRTSRKDILMLLQGPVDVGDVPDVIKGEVLVDSRGQGSFQR